MYRSHTCGELRISDVNKQVTLAGWVQRSRKMGGMTFIDLRDRYGITQLVFNEEVNAELCERANRLGREFVIQVKGTVNERFSKNQHIPTGDIEIIVSELDVLNSSLTPPFTIEENTDGGDDIRMKYRYLDLRRANVRSNLELRHKMTIEVRKYLDSQGIHRSGNSDSGRLHTRRCTRFRRSFTHEPGTILCLASKPADTETVVDGFRFRPLFPDREMFP